ncbi:MAG: histidine phosphotransferase family protein [Bdellovibrionales bacterium]
MQIDLRVLELLSSKICHDLISPVSAINNGVELIEDIGETVVDEAMKLIADSASVSSRRLKLFRIAYGRAGSEESLPVKDVRLVAAQYFEVGKIKLHWDEALALSDLSEKRGALKTLINMLLLSEEVLAYGGTITLQRIEGEGTLGCRLEIVGKSAQLSPSFGDALNGITPVEDLTPRTIQSYMTGRFASTFDLSILPSSPCPDQLDLTLLVKAPEYDSDRPL